MPMTPTRPSAARELFAFYLEAGVDAWLGETPINRFVDEPGPAVDPVSAAAAATAEAEASPPSRIRTTLPPKGGAAPTERPAAPAPPAPEAAVMAAREAARSAATLEELRTILERFDGCALKTTAKQLVFADGNPQARLMFVGEAPGRDEDIEGLPFVGRSGKLLDRIAAAIGLDRTSFYIANIVPWRPPGNRTPTPQESQICVPFIQRQIELANPDILVSLGGPSAQTLLGVTEGIMRTRGRWFTFNTGTREIKAIATLHPAYLLRQPLAKRQVWQDFLKIRQALDAPK